MDPEFLIICQIYSGLGSLPRFHVCQEGGGGGAETQCFLTVYTPNFTIGREMLIVCCVFQLFVHWQGISGKKCDEYWQYLDQYFSDNYETK